MPQLSPMKWFTLYILTITMTMTIMIKMNYFFMNKISPTKSLQSSSSNYQMKWKSLT